mmetsp:Transcript_13383/g.25578  ORF Transcript_13383/g.25578 Transcript_13383/m.25578 type:complete len:496 (-) Transcript_13383:134-1621(-)
MPGITDIAPETQHTSEKKQKKTKKDKKEKTSKKASKRDRSELEAKQEKTDKKKNKKQKPEAPAEQDASSAAKEYWAENQISTLGDVPLPDPMRTFDETPFGEPVKQVFKDMGFTKPSPIQASAWPVAMSGKNLVAVAKTGSGKTVAFLLPALHKLSTGELGKTRDGPTALVLAPTRELAQQIQVECNKFHKVCQCQPAVCIYGGVPKGPQIGDMRKGPEVVIGTPGRMVDLMDMKALSVARVRYLVLDEGDRMLDMGFEPQIKRILGEIAPESRQTLFFTATWNKSVQKMANNYLTAGGAESLVNITVGSTEDLVANTAINQKFHALDDSEKDAKLWQLLEEFPEGSKVVAFGNTKRRVDHLAKACWNAGFGASAIHGDKTQAERNAALAKFQAGEWPLMFATDVAARGLDIQGVTHVINYDMPRDVENYIHRIGRTARAGKSGISITFWNQTYDVACAPALAKIAREAAQEVPAWLEEWAKKAERGKKDKHWAY